MDELFRNILGITCTNVCFTSLQDFPVLYMLVCFSSVLLCHYCLAFHIKMFCICFSLYSINIHVILFYSIQNIPDCTSQEFLLGLVN